MVANSSICNCVQNEKKENKERCSANLKFGNHLGMARRLRTLTNRVHTINFVNFQIAEVEKRAAQLKQEIEDYRANRLKQVEEYITDLAKKAEELENMQVMVKRFLQESSTATIVTERENKDKECNKAHRLDTTTRLNCDEQALIRNGGKLL